MDNQRIHVKTWWPTTIIVGNHHDRADFNERLAAIIMRKEREIKAANDTPQPIAGVQDGLTAYWTKFNVLNWREPECGDLAAMMLEGINAFIRTVGDPDDPDYAISGISCWANVLRPGESLDIHHHDPGFASAHYIVQGGESGSEKHGTESGHTVYFRPGFMERSHGDVMGSPWDSDWRISVPAVTGTLTVFPSYVRHEVKTYMGGTERITVALDVYINKQNVPFRFAPPRWYVPRAARASIPASA
jgi:hypothetical protein